MWLYPIIDGGLPVLMNMSRREFSNDTTHVMIRSLICLSVPFFKYFFFFPFSLFSLLNFNANFYFSLLVRASCSSSFFLFDRLISFPLGFLLFGFIWAQAQMDTLSALFFRAHQLGISLYQSISCSLLRTTFLYPCSVCFKNVQPKGLLTVEHFPQALFILFHEVFNTEYRFRYTSFMLVLEKSSRNEICTPSRNFNSSISPLLYFIFTAEISHYNLGQTFQLKRKLGGAFALF